MSNKVFEELGDAQKHLLSRGFVKMNPYDFVKNDKFISITKVQDGFILAEVRA